MSYYRVPDLGGFDVGRKVIYPGSRETLPEVAPLYLGPLNIEAGAADSRTP